MCKAARCGWKKVVDGKCCTQDAYLLHIPMHGLWTPNEGINQRNQKIWADVADKICRVGVDFWPCSEGDFHTGCP